MSMQQITILWKGGGYAGHHFLGGFMHLRHYHWTGTTDNFPHSDGVPPIDGGLPKPPNRWKRFISWLKWVIKGGKLGGQKPCVHGMSQSEYCDQCSLDSDMSLLDVESGEPATGAKE